MTPRPGAAPAAIAAQALALRARPSRRQPRHALRPGDQATSTTSTTDARVGPLQAIAPGPVQAIVFRRLYCPGCGDLPEHVEWARGGARYTRDFDDLTAWLAQQMSQTQVTRLMRIGWETVAKIVTRVVAEKLPGSRLGGHEIIS